MAEQSAQVLAARPPLSKRQGEILDFIRVRVAKMGYPPTFREICTEFKLRSTNGVADHIKALKRKGYLSFEETKSRTLRPIDMPSRKKALKLRGANDGPGAVRIPVLGRIAAGEPILVPGESAPERHIALDAALMRGHCDAFALDVTGDSMVEAGILDGDTVFISPRDYADVGQIAVFLLDNNEATLKRYYPEKERVRLQPANGKLKPRYIYPSEGQSLRILGVVTGVWRHVG